MKEEKTPAFAKLQAAKKRKCHTFDVSGFFDMRGESAAKVAIRVATKREQDLAWARAEEYAYKLRGKELHEAYKDQSGILEDAKAAFLLAQVVRDPDDPDNMPMWATGDVITDRLTGDQIATILNLALEVKNRESPAPIQIDFERLDALIAGCNAVAYTDIPEQVLAPYQREYLTHAFVLASQKVAELRAEIVQLTLELDAERNGRSVGGTGVSEGGEEVSVAPAEADEKDPGQGG